MEILPQVNETDLERVFEYYNHSNYFEALRVPILLIFSTADLLNPPGTEWTYFPEYKGPCGLRW